MNAKLNEVINALECTAMRIKDERDILRAALILLLSEIDNLNGVEYSRDLEPYKAAACWDDALQGARYALSKVQ